MKKVHFSFSKQWISVFTLFLMLTFFFSCSRRSEVSHLLLNQNGGSGAVPDTVYLTDTVTASGEGQMILKPFIALGGDQNIQIGYSGGDIIIPIVSNSSWTASSDESWMQLSKTEGGENTDTIVVTIDKNTANNKRSGDIVIESTSDDLKTTLTFVQYEGSENFFVKEDGSGEGHAWMEACQLDDALKGAESGDTIFIAAGTYLPESVLAGAEGDNDDNDKTFEIAKNITIIGGYPSNATMGAVANPDQYETILSGDDTYYHVVTVTAPSEPDAEVHIEGVSIIKGKSLETSQSLVTSSVNNEEYDRLYAGGVFVIGSTVTLSNVVVTENSAFYGGGVVANNANVTIKNSEVIKNTSSSTAAGLRVMSGAKVKVEDSKINENTSTSSFAGGMYIMGGTEITILNSEVNKNETAGNGCGIRGNANATITIKNSEVNNNIAGDGGGAMWLDGVDITIENCEINGNEAQGGHSGGIYAKNSSNVEITNSEINENKAETHGGGIYAYNESNVEITDSEINENNAGTNSGGILIDKKSSLTISNSEINKNTTNTSFAGGIRTIYNSTLTIKNSVIEGNEAAKRGGGLYLHETIADIHDTKINNNTTNEYGGGVVIFEKVSDVSFYNCEINDNVSTGRAGGLYTDAGKLHIYNSRVIGNQANGWAPGLYLHNNGDDYIVNTIIANNVGTADNGGGIFLYLHSSLTLINSTITQNNTTGEGGGIYRRGGSGKADNHLTIYNSIISGNEQKSGSSGLVMDDITHPSEYYATVVGEGVYDGTGSTTGDTFDPNSLGNIFLPNGTGNPALSEGMNGSDLTGLGLTNVEDSFIETDIDGNDRNDKIMGYKIP